MRPLPPPRHFLYYAETLLSGALLANGEALRAVADVVLSSWSCAALLLPC